MEKMMMVEDFDTVNHLVLNFYPDGYSIAVKLNEFPVFTSETILETARISYEETSLLDYIENEELPPLLVEMIDSSPKLSQYKIWHNGCLILEVRDKIESEDTDNNSHDTYNYRRSQNTAKLVSQSIARYEKHLMKNSKTHEPQSRLVADCDHTEHSTTEQIQSIQDAEVTRNYFILLKPTNLSMLYDVLNLTDSKCWSTQERLQLESQIVLYNSPNLSLETDATIDQKVENLETAHRLAVICNSPETSPGGGKFGNSEQHSKLKSNRMSVGRKRRLKDIYMNRTIHLSHNKSNGGNHNKNGGNGGARNGGHHSRVYNLYSTNQPTDNQLESPVPQSLPPELTLQQFLAARRTRKQKSSSSFVPTPRFYRYKRNSSYK